jgi:2-polyprenyl-3-methyl-5-hydroxy-6-metoxy-1,4-benzoquinol methylase
MKAEAMQPYALALVDCLKGNREASITVRRDDGFRSELPAKVFLRPPEEFSTIEKKALDLCHGAILDVGAGGGSISLYLQSKRARIKAIDICPELIGIMRWRGVENVEQEDVFRLNDAQFDTILMLGNGIGMVETLDGWNPF